MQFDDTKNEIGSKINLIVLDEHGRFVIEDRELLEIVSGGAIVKPKPSPSPSPNPPPPSLDVFCGDIFCGDTLCGNTVCKP